MNKRSRSVSQPAPQSQPQTRLARAQHSDTPETGRHNGTRDAAANGVRSEHGWAEAKLFRSEAERASKGPSGGGTPNPVGRWLPPAGS